MLDVHNQITGGMSQIHRGPEYSSHLDVLCNGEKLTLTNESVGMSSYSQIVKLSTCRRLDLRSGTRSNHYDTKGLGRIFDQKLSFFLSKHSNPDSYPQ